MASSIEAFLIVFKRFLFVSAITLVPTVLYANCFELVDRNGAVIYRATTPPWSLSWPADDSSIRDASLARGEKLIMYHNPQCPRENVIIVREPQRAVHDNKESITVPGMRSESGKPMAGEKREIVVKTQGAVPKASEELLEGNAGSKKEDLSKKRLEQWLATKDETYKKYAEEREALMSKPPSLPETSRQREEVRGTSQGPFSYLPSQRAASQSPLHGSVSCRIERVGGLEVKIITYNEGGTTYAINGGALSRAGAMGWVDGTSRFSSGQMRSMINRGLARCR